MLDATRSVCTLVLVFAALALANDVRAGQVTSVSSGTLSRQAFTADPTNVFSFTPDNDNVDSFFKNPDDTWSGNWIEYDVDSFSMAPVDMVFTVSDSTTGGTSEYELQMRWHNRTDVEWTQVRMELGFGVGSQFVPSTLDDGLDFDYPGYDPLPELLKVNYQPVPGLSDEQLADAMVMSGPPWKAPSNAAPKSTAGQTANRAMTGDQRALKELVDEATLGGRKPLSVNDADTILDWAQEYNYRGVRASPGDVGVPSNWTANPQPHIHIPGAGRGGHVPVQPGVQPR